MRAYKSIGFVLVVLFLACGLQAQEVTINDNLEIESDGTIEYLNDATVWDDLNVYPDAISKGSSAPTWSSFINGLYLNMFAGGTNQQVYFTVQIPHGYKEGTDLQPHIHWTVPSGGGAPAIDGVEWGLEYSVISIGGIYPASETIYADSIIPSITTYAEEQHFISAFPAIDGTGLGISSIISCRLFRNATNDSYTGLAGLLGLDFHYEQDTQGSRQPFIK